MEQQLKCPNVLLQVRKASVSLEDKLSFLQAEVKFSEEVQRILSRTQIQIKSEVPVSCPPVCPPSACLCPALTLHLLQAASSNLQQSELSSRLEDLRRRMKNVEVERPAAPVRPGRTSSCGLLPLCVPDRFWF